jgi:hypothetical protein
MNIGRYVVGAAGIQKLAAPGQGLVVRAQVGLDVILIDFRSAAFGKPAKGSYRMRMGFGVLKLLAKSAVDQPSAERGAVFKGMFVDFQAGGKQDGDGTQDGERAFEKAAW